MTIIEAEKELEELKVAMSEQQCSVHDDPAKSSFCRMDSCSAFRQGFVKKVIGLQDCPAHPEYEVYPPNCKHASNYLLKYTLSKVQSTST